MTENSKKTYSVREVCKICGIGRSTFYVALGTGALTAVKLGRRTLIPAESLDSWLNSLPTVPVSKPFKKGG